MLMSTIRISDFDKKVLNVSLLDILLCVECLGTRTPFWMINRFDVISEADFIYNNVGLVDSLILDSLTGVVFSNQQLKKVSMGIRQEIDVTLTSFDESACIKLNASGGVMLSNYLFRVELIDSSYWEITSTDETIISGFLDFFGTQKANKVT